MYISFDELKDKIMSASNGGLDIFLDLYPRANTKKNFKLREEERTASASLHQSEKDGVWTLTDFGDNQKPVNAIFAYANENSIKYSTAIIELAKRYNIATGSQKQISKPDFKEYPLGNAPFELDEDTGYYFETTDEFTDAEYKILGPYVDKETCKKCNCYKVISMASEVTDKKTGAKKILQRFSNEAYPIFAFINTYNKKTFYKIYQPRSENKAYKFMFVGGRPRGFINGMERIIKYYQPKYEAWLEERSKALEYGNDFKDPEPAKIDNVIICSGERDALNMTSLGYFVVWHNSETAEWNKNEIKKIYDNADNIINIPDIDTTGIAQGKKLAEKFLSIKTLWLPESLRKKKDFRGNARKDLTDYFFLNNYKKKSDFLINIDALITKASPLQFWNTKTTKNGIKYSISNTILNYFLKHYGFHRFEIEGSKEGWVFIRKQKHLVEKVTIRDIYRFIDDFLENRSMPLELRDLAINSTNISAEKIARMKDIKLDFTNFSAKHQTFSFSHENWTVDKNGIRVSDSLSSNCTWSDDVIDKKITRRRGLEIDTSNIKILDDFFKISKDDDENWQIEIIEKHCDIFNFLINTSRMHWQDEFINTWKEDNDTRDVKEIYADDENKKYQEENKFTINGSRLTTEQIQEQVHHLVNKIYTIGYLLHSYKDESNAWGVFAMENDMIDDDTSNGGSGKSLILKTIEELKNVEVRPANSHELFKDKFLYDGVTKHTDTVVFDDAGQGFNMREIFSDITSDMRVNPKNGTPFSIPFKDSPKIAISSNFALRKTDQSILRRLLIIATSNFYHHQDDNLIGRQPVDDFGGSFFQNWDVEQYNKYINFYLQCLKFYLGQPKKIEPPMNSIAQRNLTAQIGKHFMDFAEELFSTTEANSQGHVEFNKSELKTKVHQYHKRISGLSSTAIASNMKAYCKLKGYEYMPGRDRYQKKEEGKLVDYILIYTGEVNPEIDDMPF